MANGRLNNTADKYIQDMGPSKAKSTKDLQRNIEAEEKLRANIKKKYAKQGITDQEILDAAYRKASEKYYAKRNKETLEETKKRLKEEYEISVTYQDKLKNKAKQIGVALISATGAGLDKIGLSVDNYLGSYSKYMSGIEARIQGSGKSFAALTGSIRAGIGSSQYVSQTRMLENLNRLVELGITQNIEQRAFLATVSDKIVTTFDAFDSNLSRLIRIQQADSTAARLGLEAQLTQFFNKNFGDTSYLSNLFDTVSANILAANAQLGRNRSVEFEYNVQKWLGSLSAVGVSDTTIQQLAQGIGYLGSGDISALSSSEQLQNLLVMAAQKSGLNYASMLTGGMSAEDVNKLLRGVVGFGQQIASTSNQVVKSQYAQMFGMTITDLTALLNLSSKDLVDISSNMLTYSQAVAETTRQIGQIPSRLALSERIDNLIENTMTSIGERVASNAATYTAWMVNDIMLKSMGGIEISLPTPFVGWQDININKIAKQAIVGYNVLAELGSIISGLSGANQLTNWESIWKTEDFKHRGWGFTGLSRTGASRTVSQTMYVGSTSESDLYSGSLMAAEDASKQQTVAGTEDASQQMAQSIEQASNINSILNILERWSNTGFEVKVSRDIW